MAKRKSTARHMTPAMLDAGVTALSSVYDDLPDFIMERIVVEVYAAVRRVDSSCQKNKIPSKAVHVIRALPLPEIEK